MDYIAVIWKTSDPDNPIEMYHEVGDDGWETRKVEAYSNGHLDFADSAMKTGSTWLSPEKMIEIEEINEDNEFVARSISKQEFEDKWQQAINMHPDLRLP